MPLPPSTSLAVAAAVEHFRQQLELTIDGLVFATVMHGAEISVGRLRAIVHCEVSATVDELMILAVALDTTPAELLSFVPEDALWPEHQLPTAMPVIRLHDRIQQGDYDLAQARVGLAYAEQRLGWLRED
ncbi:helix-turn-helix domain-containing protein [Brachybacterium hainanense]|uniref:Helix-turn-helix domain-containing protein n=1 Tax=Brachybacterium hainanense TaxID=1541174 RepID=A0ABV6RC79_9MICO